MIGNPVLAAQIVELQWGDTDGLAWYNVLSELGLTEIGSGYSRTAFLHGATRIVYKVNDEEYYTAQNDQEFENFQMVRSWRKSWITAPRARLFEDSQIIAMPYIPDKSGVCKQYASSLIGEGHSGFVCSKLDTCWPGFIRRWPQRRTMLENHSLTDVHRGNVHRYLNKWWLIDGGE